MYSFLLVRDCELTIDNHKARGLRHASVPTKARLTYFQDRSLTLDLQYKSEDSWINCFTLTAPETNIAIPSVAYLGLSAETGELSDNHDIISLKTQNLYNVGPDTGIRPPPTGPASRGRPAQQQQTEKQGGSWGWFLFKTVLFLGAVVGGYVGWTSYRAKQRYSRF